MLLSRSMTERQSTESGRLWDGGSADLSVHLQCKDTTENNTENNVEDNIKTPLEAPKRSVSADQIFLPLVLRFRSPTPTSNHSVQEAYSLVLEFSNSPYYQHISPIRLPYLRAPRPGTEEQQLAFPYTYKVMLSVRPKQPVPAVFNVIRRRGGGAFDCLIHAFMYADHDQFLDS